jgi:hypothetical protein
MPLARNPLEYNLGFNQYGRYVNSKGTENAAFDKIEDLWNVTLTDSDEESEEEEALGTIPEEIEKGDFEGLYRTIEESKGKMFVIKMESEGKAMLDWYVTQVDWDETIEAEARTEGKYHLRWYVPHHQDSRNKVLADCRFWPEVHEKDEQGNLTCMRAVGPGKATKAYLNKHNLDFYAWKMDLWKDRVVGPFCLETVNGVSSRVPTRVWQELVEKASAQNIYVANLHQIVPVK